jgi:hypothetical protein
MPVVLMTSSYIDEGDRLLARQAGATSFVLRTPNFVHLRMARDGEKGHPGHRIGMERWGYRGRNGDSKLGRLRGNQGVPVSRGIRCRGG